LAENLNVAAQYADWLKGDPEKHLHSLAVDEAVILHRDKKPIAVYKDREHVLHAYSAVCPHLQCIVNWNSTEKSFLSQKIIHETGLKFHI
jgi:Rieske Fe-S protein